MNTTLSLIPSLVNYLDLIKHLKKKILVLDFMFLLCIPILAQTSVNDSEFWGSADSYLQRQTARTLELVDQALKEYPPIMGNGITRRLALYNVDAVLHNTTFDQSEQLMDYVKTRMNNVIEGLKTPLTAEMSIYKLYNHGFIVRTKGATVAFDMVMGSSYQLIPDELMTQLVDLCDVMFLSHRHRDHVDPGVVKMFTDRGKKVVGPDEALPNNKMMIHFREERIADLSIELPGDTLQIKVLPGHQSQVQNNIYVITTSEGLTYVQTGDQYQRTDIPWITSVKNEIPKVDVLLINCWVMQLKTHVEGFNPELVITGHENEMGHTIDHREAYWMSYLKLDELDRPYSLMTWGECYNYNKKPN